MSREKSPDISHRGRNSATITVRLSLPDYGVLKEGAARERLGLSEYAKKVLLSGIQRVHAMNSPETTHEKANSELIKPEIHSVHAIHVLGSNILQIYNPLVHKVGDRVLMRQGKKLVQAIVPTLDADGRVMDASL